jgi:glucoamylase
VALNARDDPVLVIGDAWQSLIPGTRVLRSARDADLLVAQERAWLAAGTVPGQSTEFEQLARNALLDLRILVQRNGAAVAGWSPQWRYVWPRDAAFTAVALAATGHVADAVRVLRFLQRVQRRDGLFEPRYLPDASGVPDRRPFQLDGPGWALWAAEAVRALDPGSASRLSGLVERSAGAAFRAVQDHLGLPPVSSDYWEVDEKRQTLGTAAPLLAGLQSAARWYAATGDAPEARRMAAAAQRLESAIERRFGAYGYPRHMGGRHRDAAVAMLLPPFASRVKPGVVQAWRQAARELARPAGGLAPGAGWKRDGISWTAETALFALTAAAVGDTGPARHWLRWLWAHRTEAGSLPEKVLRDGRPAAVAPLAWTAALVLLTIRELHDREGSPPRNGAGSFAIMKGCCAGVCPGRATR